MKLQPRTIEKISQLIIEEIEYRSGPVLVTFFNELGFNDEYSQEFPSRLNYTKNKLQIINGTQRMVLCLEKLFAPINFIGNFEKLDKFIAEINQYLSFDGYKVIKNENKIKVRPLIKDITSGFSYEISEEDFLKKEFNDISIRALKLDEAVTEILEQRLKEIKKCLSSKSPLATIFLCGSTLEGILFSLAKNYPQKFNSALISPKDTDGKVLQFNEWKLNNLIDVAKEIGFIKEDIKKFSHLLRDFRNYIHPHQQLKEGFNPDERTANICWKVLEASIFQIIEYQR